MTRPVVAFFNNKGGVGKTSLVYHLAWMLSDLGTRVLAADLDPQANLTASFLRDDAIETLWEHEAGRVRTIYDAVRPLIEGTGDIAAVNPETIIDPTSGSVVDRLSLLPGDMALSSFEDELSGTWPKCSDGDIRAFRVTSALWRVAQQSAELAGAEIILFDVGPNLGAINRSALISSDFVVVPLAPDLYSLQGLRNLGPTLRKWRTEWGERQAKNPQPRLLPLPAGAIRPLGYVVLQHAIRLDRPVSAYQKWMVRIPTTYHTTVLMDNLEVSEIATDPAQICQIKHYRSLMPMAQEAHKPIFKLRPADGAIGAHQTAVKSVYEDFRNFASELRSRMQAPQTNLF